VCERERESVCSDRLLSVLMLANEMNRNDLKNTHTQNGFTNVLDV